MKFHIRVFVPNDGGAYNPAPIHDFDMDTGESSGFIPNIGDVLCWDASGDHYKVTARYFEYSKSACAIMVEPCTDKFPQA